MQTVERLSTDFGDFPVPPEMAALLVKWRKRNPGWPDMRTKVGKEWVAMFKAFTKSKADEYMASR